MHRLPNHCRATSWRHPAPLHDFSGMSTTQAAASPRLVEDDHELADMIDGIEVGAGTESGPASASCPVPDGENGGYFSSLSSSSSSERI